MVLGIKCWITADLEASYGRVPMASFHRFWSVGFRIECFTAEFALTWLIGPCVLLLLFSAWQRTQGRGDVAYVFG
jgi:hypothetical protein